MWCISDDHDLLFNLANAVILWTDTGLCIKLEPYSFDDHETDNV